MELNIELRKPTPEENNRRYDTKSKSYKGERFDRGERIIMVNGERWGRTIVTSHGRRGTKHTFQQNGGSELDVSVRSQKRQRWAASDNWRPTEEVVLEKAKELIKSGQLRHPSIVQRENEQAMERYRERAGEAEKKRVEAFRTKAMEALQINDPTSAIIDRVVAAMEWAQTQ